MAKEIIPILILTIVFLGTALILGLLFFPIGIIILKVICMIVLVIALIFLLIEINNYLSNVLT